MPPNFESYPFLKRIINDVYKDKIDIAKEVKGAFDTNWSEEYKLFYSKQPGSKPYVKRVFLRFKEKKRKKAGFCHIRPISDSSELSETYIVPPDNLEVGKKTFLTCMDNYKVYGEEVECVPYIMPESIFGMCIQASIWICLNILEKREMVKTPLCIPEIQNLVSGSPYADREGLLFRQAARFLRMCRSSAFYIRNWPDPLLNDEQMLLELYAYVESRLPVILGVEVSDLKYWDNSQSGYHSIVAIGHTIGRNKVNSFIFHDESRLPYINISNTDLLEAWHTPIELGPEEIQPTLREMLVAVPPEVSLPFHEIYHQFEELLIILRQKGETEDRSDRLVIRPRLMRTDQLYFETNNSLLLASLTEADWPKYVWTIFIFDQNADRMDIKNSKGFFARDATGKSEFRFFYFSDKKHAIYQLKESGSVYRRKTPRSKRKI